MESAAELSAEIKEAHLAKLAEAKEKIKEVSWIQRVFGKKEADDE